MARPTTGDRHAAGRPAGAAGRAAGAAGGLPQQPTCRISRCSARWRRRCWKAAWAAWSPSATPSTSRPRGCWSSAFTANWPPGRRVGPGLQEAAPQTARRHRPLAAPAAPTPRPSSCKTGSSPNSTRSATTRPCSSRSPASKPRPASPASPASPAAPARASRPPPMYRFHGRALELLELERAFRRYPAVLLSGMGGMGKTALAREAAAWWLRTGRFDAAVFCSFEQKPGPSGWCSCSARRWKARLQRPLRPRSSGRPPSSCSASTACCWCGTISSRRCRFISGKALPPSPLSRAERGTRTSRPFGPSLSGVGEVRARASPPLTSAPTTAPSSTGCTAS